MSAERMSCPLCRMPNGTDIHNGDAAFTKDGGVEWLRWPKDAREAMRQWDALPPAALAAPSQPAEQAAQAEQQPKRSTWKSDGGWKCLNCQKSIADHEDQTLCPTQPAQQPQEALPQPRWIERWYGSGGAEGMEGWSILEEESRNLVAYLGRGIASDVVAAIVASHNAALSRAPVPEAGLTDEQIDKIADSIPDDKDSHPASTKWHRLFSRAILAAAKGGKQ